MRPLPGVVLLALVTSCTLVNDFEDLRSDGGGAGGQTAEGGGGAAPNPCETLVRGACGPRRKCTLAVVAQGVPGGLLCGPSGDVEAWSACSSDADCADGAWCEAATSVCKPWCSDAPECPTGAACVSAKRSDGTPVPELLVCTSHCRPDAPAARCGPGVSCVIASLASPEGDCVKAGTTLAGCPCSGDADCAVGLRCASDQICRAWCDVDGAGACPGGFDCGATITSYDGTDFGLCSTLSCPN